MSNESVQVPSLSYLPSLTHRIHCSPLKVRVDVRDIWDSSTSTIKQAASSLAKTLGHQITAEAEWPALWDELKDHFPDKSGFVLTISRYTVAWYEMLLARVEDDAHAEWTENLLEMLSAKPRGGITLKVEVGTRTQWTYSRLT